ncbi:MAG: 6-bladed beta-propeller [Tannerellaceae bacterium]|jgi:hypothetical protein|nr:6-bladed beta-propeller [Tannerellaceae bacterium]
MKSVTAISATILFVTAGCVGCKPSGITSNDIITVDVTASYPKKELILQDCFDVEYVPLETTDEFITRANIQTISKDFIITRNGARNGEIFIFDRKGKGVRVINRFGQGANEYSSILGLTLDEEYGEIFVNNYLSRNIPVYDLERNYKRTLKNEESISYDQINNFDRDNLICVDGDNIFDDVKRNIFRIISKQDGSVIKEIQIIYKEKRLPKVVHNENAEYISHARNWLIIPYGDSRVLVDTSSDTIYKFQPDHNMVPFMIRTPSIQSMYPGVFLFPGVLTDRYYFMETVKTEYNFETTEGWPSIDLMYDRQEKAIFEHVIYNDDFSTKRPVNTAFELTPLAYDLIDKEVAFAEKIEAFELVEAYKEGKLKGRLAEIAAGLDEEDNAVIMLAKHKK